MDQVFSFLQPGHGPSDLRVADGNKLPIDFHKCLICSGSSDLKTFNFSYFFS